MPALKTHQNFVKDAQRVHGDRYKYDKVMYVNGNSKVFITCPKHGDFEQIPRSHLQGKGCPFSPQRNSIDQDEFLRRARSVHGDKYTYDKAVYKGTGHPIIVTCQKHGQFSLTAYKHMTGQGCRGCGGDAKALTVDQWLASAKECHGDRYDYRDAVYILSCHKVIIRCKDHGPFQQRPNDHLQGSGCPRCSHRVSKPSIEWLDAMARIDDTHIQHGGNGGEVRLAGTKWHADGFSADLNKVYEFHGDYFHGNPRKFPADTLNKRCKRTMGELYERTCKRQKAIEDLGYAYECFWEDELNTAKTLLTLCDVRA